MNFIHNLILLVSVFWISTSSALQPLSGDEMGDVTGQGGVYLSGDLTINADGGPLNESGPSDNGYC